MILRLWYVLASSYLISSYRDLIAGVPSDRKSTRRAQVSATISGPHLVARCPVLCLLPQCLYPVSSTMPSSKTVPRPILKRPGVPIEAPVPRTESKQLLHIDPGLFQPLVRFPSTSSLTCTFLVHSPSSYDRSPITVTPNKLALPERGCPGRTYLPGDETLSAAKELASRNNGGGRLRGRSPSERHLRSHARLPADAGQSGSNCHGEKVSDEGLGPLKGGISLICPRRGPSTTKCRISPHTVPCTSLNLCRMAVSDPVRCAAGFERTSSPLSSPRTAALALGEVSPTLSSLSISPRSRPPSPLAFRARNYMTFSRSSSPASSCGTSPASSRSSSPCRDVLMFTPSTRRRRNLSARPRQRRTTSDLDINLTSFADNGLLSIDSCDEGCLGGF